MMSARLGAPTTAEAFVGEDILFGRTGPPLDDGGLATGVGRMECTCEGEEEGCICGSCGELSIPRVGADSDTEAEVPKDGESV